MRKNIKGYMIAIPDKDNPGEVEYYHVNGPRFLYKGKIVKEYFEDDSEVVVEVKSNKENNQHKKTTEKTKNIKRDEEEIRLQIASEVKRILKQKNAPQNERVNKKTQTKKKKVKKKISKPQKDDKYFKLRYTAPKERGIVARIINRMKYESGWYEDIEDYLDDENNFVWDDMEWSKNAEKRRDQRLYKRVQAYEDAEADIAMKKAFITVKVTTVAALLATLGLSVNFLCNEVNDLINNSSYVAQAQEKSTLANANSGQIEYAERLLAKLDYNFEYLSHQELLDTIIRVGSKPSKITESRAMATIKKATEYADQKLLEEIIKEAYEDEYESFGEEKKQELNQVVYEMLNDDVKIWIRSPQKVAELKQKDEVNTLETEDIESER